MCVLEDPEEGKSVAFSLLDDATPPELIPASDSSSNSEDATRLSWRHEKSVTRAHAKAAVKSRAASHTVTHARTTVPKPPLPIKAARAIQNCAHAHNKTHAVAVPPPIRQRSSLKQSEHSPRSSSDKHVHFGNLEMRNYEIVLGDHPDCSSGPPVSYAMCFLLK